MVLRPTGGGGHFVSQLMFPKFNLNKDNYLRDILVPFLMAPLPKMVHAWP